MRSSLKVLITGACGQLGQAFATLLTRQGNRCLLADIEEGREDIHRLDITKLDDVRCFIQSDPVDCIINCAAYNAVDKAEVEWQTAFLVNGIGTRNLSLVASETDAILVHYSTDYVFSGNKNQPYTILDSPDPISKYGESKLLGERLMLGNSSRFYLIRVSWLFGMGNVNFPRQVLQWSQGSKELRIVDDQVSCPTFTDDLAKATRDLLDTDAFGMYHVTNTGYCSRYDWAEYILDSCGWEGNLLRAKSADFETLAKRPKFSALDNFGTKETIGYNLPSWKDATGRFLKQLEVT